MRRPDLRIRVQLTVSVCLFTLICLISLAVSIYVLSRGTILDLQRGNLDLNCRMIREECTQEVEDEYEAFYRLMASSPVRDIYSADSTTESMVQSVELLHDSFGPNRVLQLNLYYPNGSLVIEINASSANDTVFPQDLLPISAAMAEDAVNNMTALNASSQFNITGESILINQGLLIGPQHINETVGGTAYMMSLTLPVSDSGGALDPAAATDHLVDGYATFVFSALRLQTILSAVELTSSESLVGSTALCVADQNLTYFTQLIPFNDPTVVDYYNITNSSLYWSSYKTHSQLNFSGDFPIPPEMATVLAQDELPSAGIDRGPEKSMISIAQFTIMNQTYYVVVLQSHQGVYEMPHKLRNNIVISSCAIAAAMVIFTYLFVSFGARQILRLKMAATYQHPRYKRWWILPMPWWLTPAGGVDRAESEYVVPEKVPLRRHVRDELDDITDRFNLMSAELERQYAKLEQRVKQRKAEIEQAREAADLANAAKSHFLARVTHELRTPLNGIIGTATLCMDEDNIDDVHKSLLTIFKCGELLLHLMTDLLSFSQNEVENLELELREFRMPDITSQLQAIFTEQCSTKKIVLKVLCTDNFDNLVFSGDTNRILQVIFNLMSNGIKFTPAGGVVCFRAAIGSKVAADVVDLVFTVTDNGPGIAPEMQDRVFEAFVQGDISTQVKKAGVGLGLSICKQLAERMNGTITLTSALGHGCKFVFVVPLRFRKLNPDSSVSLSVDSMDIAGSVVRSGRHATSPGRRSPSGVRGDELSPTTPPVNGKEFGSSQSTPDVRGEDTPETAKTHSMFLSRTSRTLSTASLKAKEFTRRLTQDSATRQREKEQKERRQSREKQRTVRESDEEGLLKRGNSGSGTNDASSAAAAQAAASANIGGVNASAKKREQNEEIRRALDVRSESRAESRSESRSDVRTDDGSSSRPGSPPCEDESGGTKSPDRRSDGALSPRPRPRRCATDDVRDAPLPDADAPSLPSTPPGRRDSLNSANNLSVIQSIPQSDAAIKKEDLNVLVVDDNLVNQEVMVRMLNLEGVKSIAVAEDGSVAVDKVKAASAAGTPFNIVFMDVQMPRMDGRQASRLIRTELHLNMPIVAVSAFANDKNADECLDAGMNLFLSKPLVRTHLQEILRRLSQ